MALRLFIAFPFSDLIKGRCVALQNLGRKRIDSVRWCCSDQLHLTLLFLGRIEASEQNAIEDVIRNVAKRFSPFKVKVSGLGLFPGPKRPRVLWLGISKEAPLMVLQKELSVGIAQLGFPIEKRAYEPHLTLARFKKGDKPPMGPLLAWIKQKEGVNLGDCDVKEMLLMESQLRPEGAVYQTRLRVPFARDGVA